MPTNEQVELAVDRMDIQEVLMRYAQGLDRFDESQIAAVYHADGQDDRGGNPIPGSRFAKDVLSAERNGQYLLTRHHLGNITIDVRGDVARSETYFTAIHRYRRDGQLVDLTICGRYLDRFERRGNKWKIAYRWRVRDWTRIDPVAEEAPPPPPGWLIAQRSMADPLYTVLRAEHADPT